MIAQWQVHPSSVKLQPSSDPGTDFSERLWEVFPAPNTPGLNVLKDQGLEYLPFFDCDGLIALASIIDEVLPSRSIVFQLALDDFSDANGSRASSHIVDLNFENSLDISKLRIDDRYVLGKIDLNTYLYMDYGDFSSVITETRILERLGMSRDIIRLENMKSSLINSSDKNYVDFYRPLVDLAISQYI